MKAKAHCEFLEAKWVSFNSLFCLNNSQNWIRFTMRWDREKLQILTLGKTGPLNVCIFLVMKFYSTLKTIEILCKFLHIFTVWVGQCLRVWERNHSWRGDRGIKPEREYLREEKDASSSGKSYKISEPAINTCVCVCVCVRSYYMSQQTNPLTHTNAHSDTIGRKKD